MRLHQLDQLVADTRAAFTRTDLATVFEEAATAAGAYNLDPDLEKRNLLKSNLANIQRASSSFEPEMGSKVRTTLARDLGLGLVFGPDAQKFAADLLEVPVEERGLILQQLQLRAGEVRELEKAIHGLGEGLARIQTEAPTAQSKANLRIAFEESAAIQGLDQLAEASAEWKTTLEGLSQLLRSEPAPVELISAESGSTVFGVEASGDLEVLITRTVAWVQNGIKDVFEIRKLYEEIHKIKSELALPEIDIDSEFTSRVDPFVVELLDGHGWGKRDKDFENVQENVKASLQTVFRFIGKGGRIEFNEEMSSDFQKEIAKGFNQLEELQLAGVQ